MEMFITMPRIGLLLIILSVAILSVSILLLLKTKGLLKKVIAIEVGNGKPKVEKQVNSNFGRSDVNNLLAQNNSLINLPSRSNLLIKAKELIKANKVKRFAMFFIDLDDFKSINKNLGPEIGDLLLQKVAERIIEELGEDSIFIAYMGGDEYGVLLECEDNTATKKLEKISEHVQYVLAKPYKVMGHDIYIRSSIGVCIYPDYANTAEKLIRFADIARYEAKKQGRDTYYFYTQDMSQKSKDLSTLGEDLHKAIEKNQLSLVYQPKLSLETGLVVSAEALVRWNHPEKGLISPEVFIPIAENIGMIITIGDWIIQAAAHDLRRLHLFGFNDLSIAINLSPAQFNKGDVAGLLAKTLHETRLEPNFLEIELTESLVMHNPEKALLMLQVLKSMGIKIAIDDFGTGYSSLSYLKSFPVDILKIDQSFVRGMHKDEDNRVIVSTIISMAKRLGLKVIAEGVETKEEAEILKQEQCDYVQGYYYSKPLDYLDLKQFCSENKRKFSTAN